MCVQVENLRRLNFYANLRFFFFNGEKRVILIFESFDFGLFVCKSMHMYFSIYSINSFKSNWIFRYSTAKMVYAFQGWKEMEMMKLAVLTWFLHSFFDWIWIFSCTWGVGCTLESNNLCSDFSQIIWFCF